MNVTINGGEYQTLAADDMRKANARERMRRYRLRHADDKVYKARVREEKRKQLAKNPEQTRKKSRERMQRYRAKHPLSEDAKKNARKTTRLWRERNPERAAASREAWVAANKEKTIAYLRRWRIEHPNYVAKSTTELMVFYAAARRARKKAAQPDWADEAAIATFYRAAKNMTQSTGVIWHVDHIVPLKHELVCGLHVEHNLQILQGADNISKNNRFIVA